MYPRFAFALLFSVCAFGLGIAIPARPQCGPNGEYLTCGSACVPDCANPESSKICTLQCVTGCFCKAGFLKNSNGECVRPEQCEAPTHHKIPMQIPSAQNMLFAYPPEVSQCKENEVFMPCGSACTPTCANPHPSSVCTRQCVVGCFCKPGYLKNEQGVCVPAERCGVAAADATPMIPAICDENEEYRQCKGCDGTCANPNPICPRICVPGCACKKGHLRDGNGRCMQAENCAVQPAPSAFMMMPPLPKCGENEVFHTCGTACPATCDNPHPSPVCTKNCVIGCFCKEGFLKNANGVCVAAANCEGPFAFAANPAPRTDKPYVDDIKCASDRETYIEDSIGAQLDCMASCGVVPYLIHGAPHVPKKCHEVTAKPACVCNFPYVRNQEGRCVERKECNKTNPFTTEASAH